MKARVRADAAIFAAFLVFGLVGLWLSKFPVDKTVWAIGFTVFALWLIIEICFISPYKHAKALTKSHEAQRDELWKQIDGLKSDVEQLNKKPLIGIRLRNECDVWIESGKTIYERLHNEGGAAIPDAKQWLGGFKEFTERNLPVADYDVVNHSNKMVERFNLEMSKVDPSYEVSMYKNLVAHRFARLTIFRNKIK